jgi:TM2 domain-containing membrane protein YozV
MSEPQEYTLRWRGREAGPYPVPEINRQLDEHEIGMGHEIFYQDKWITLEEFFAALPKPGAPAPAEQTPSLRFPPTVASPPAPIRTTTRERSSPLLFKVSVSSPSAPPPARADGSTRDLRPRHRLVFALLGILAGFLGAHNFYARQWLTGLLQLLLSIATSLMGFGIIASWLWAMAEVVIVRKDGDGIEMI